MSDLFEDRNLADDVADADANVDSESNDESDECSHADVDAATAGQGLQLAWRIAFRV